MLDHYPQQSKEPCPAATIKATTWAAARAAELAAARRNAQGTLRLRSCCLPAPTRAATAHAHTPARPRRYGHFDIARRLQRACNVSSSSPRLQAAGWLGALFGAARGGHTRVARLLLADADAPEMLGKLYADAKPKKDGPPVAPDPEKDPLAAAAGRGHQAVVELLSPHRALCGPCAAVAAAGGGHLAAFEHLVAGAGAQLLDADPDKIQDALRAATRAMDAGHWPVLEALLGAHQSDKLGPYFLPAIAQQGRIGDLKRMMAVIEEVGSEAEYLLAQISSAMVSAALSGHEEMLLALEATRRDIAARVGAGGGGGGKGEGGDRSEL